MCDVRGGSLLYGTVMIRLVLSLSSFPIPGTTLSLSLSLLSHNFMTVSCCYCSFFTLISLFQLIEDYLGGKRERKFVQTRDVKDKKVAPNSMVTPTRMLCSLVLSSSCTGCCLFNHLFVCLFVTTFFFHAYAESVRELREASSHSPSSTML